MSKEVKSLADEFADLRSALLAQGEILKALTFAVRADAAVTEKSLAEQEVLKAECLKPTWQRTQEAADRQFQGKHKYLVNMPADKVHVHQLSIMADSPEQAEMYFYRLCGINKKQSDHEATVALVVPGDAPAPAGAPAATPVPEPAPTGLWPA